MVSGKKLDPGLYVKLSAIEPPDSESWAVPMEPMEPPKGGSGLGAAAGVPSGSQDRRPCAASAVEPRRHWRRGSDRGDAGCKA